MKLLTFKHKGTAKIGYQKEGGIFDLSQIDSKLPKDLLSLLEAGEPLLNEVQSIAQADHPTAVVDANEIDYLPLIPRPPKIICIGRNYAAHAREGGVEPPTYPEIFYRGATSLIAHKAPIVRPQCSERLDYEAELVAVVGKRARHVKRAQGLAYIAGYSLFNDATLRDYQRKSSQWTIGKNFDNSGAFGPVLVTADELPAGAHGLQIQTRLNGELLQDANTQDFIFPIDDLVAKLSECMTLEPGDIIVTGTPAGVGYARTPPIFMRHGDVCEVSIEGIGTLSNPVLDEVL